MSRFRWSLIAGGLVVLIATSFAVSLAKDPSGAFSPQRGLSVSPIAPRFTPQFGTAPAGQVQFQAQRPSQGIQLTQPTPSGQPTGRSFQQYQPNAATKVVQSGQKQPAAGASQGQPRVAQPAAPRPQIGTQGQLGTRPGSSGQQAKQYQPPVGKNLPNQSSGSSPSATQPAPRSGNPVIRPKSDLPILKVNPLPPKTSDGLPPKPGTPSNPFPGRKPYPLERGSSGDKPPSDGKLPTDDKRPTPRPPRPTGPGVVIPVNPLPPWIGPPRRNPPVVGVPVTPVVPGGVVQVPPPRNPPALPPNVLPPKPEKVAPPAVEPVVEPAPDEPVLPPGDTAPLLRLETGGPRSYVSGLAFSPDGSSLYACGWDKAIQVWNRMANGQYEYSPGATLRVPTGAGLYGGLNTLVLSPDGEWLATAGQGHARDMSGERNLGWILPAGVLSRASQFDEGLIYVFNTATRTTRLLRGHRGPVQSLAFVRGSRSNPPELVSVAEERTEGTNELRPRVRYWDVGRATELASLKLTPSLDGKTWAPLPNLQGWRPGLAAWSTGPDLKQVRVAFAWGDDQFRVWDVQTGQVASAKSSPNTLTVLPLPGPGERLLTGAHADIGVWTVPVTSVGTLGAISSKQYQAAPLESVREQHLPSAVTLIPAAGGGQPLVMFVVTKYLADGRADYRLVIATATLPIKIVREFELPWRGEVRMPAIAVTHDGRTVAVAGCDRNDIEVYPVQDLVAGRNPPPQVLGSRGLNIREAAFVRADDRWGLIFSDTLKTVPGRFPENSLVFDIGQRRIEPAKDRWRLALASLDGWSAEVAQPGSLLIRRADQSALTLQLDEQQVVSSYAFCPPSPHCPVPLIAVATHLRGQPLLRVFRGDTGDPVRWCVGHTERVRSLAFSEDGRMLLSLAADRTVSVWTMSDLVERTLDQHGRIAGLTVHPQENRIIVTEAPSGLPLQRGDELVAVERKGEVIGLRSTREFYQYVLGRRPGESLSLSVRRGGQMELVACDVGQAIDESKPLFTLFVTAGERKGDWDWIGWHPLGNFDASREDVERLLGWQFNTGEADRPAKFATIGDYRDGFYRRDLLQSLIDSQKLVLPEADESPQMSLWLRYPDGTPVRTDYEDRPQLESAQVQLVAEVTGVSERRIRSLAVSFNDAEPQALKRSSEREWTVDLSKSAWKRGLHRLTVRLQTPDREVTKIERVQYRPAAPAIEWVPPWKDEIRDAVVTVKAVVNPASEPLQIQLRLHRAGQKDEVVVRTWETKETLEIAEAVAIEPGENRLELVAFNATAPADDRDLETSRIGTFVRRAAPPKAPRIALNDVFVVPEKGEAAALAAEGNVYRSTWPKVRLRGRITSELELDRATLQFAEEQRDLAGFKAGQSREFKFEETLTLHPGSQLIVVQAAVDKEQDEKRLTLAYEPPVPHIASLNVTAAAERELPKQVKPEANVFYAGYHAPSVTVVAVLDGRLEQPYRATLRVNDVPVAEDLVQIDRSQPGQHRLTAKVPLEGGKSRVVVRVENDWSRQPLGQAVEVDFRRPPEILKVLADDKLVAKPQSMAFRVRSPLPVRSARIVVDDTDERREFTVATVEDSPGEWLLRTEQLGLTVGNHTLRISATNDDGITLEPVIHNIRMEKAADPPPVLAILSPVSTETSSDKSVTVSSNKLEIQYSVNSTAPTSLRLEMRGNSAKHEIFESTTSADKVPIDGETGVEEVELFEGVNEIELTAFNRGGSSGKQLLKVAFVAKTATVEIVSVGDLKPRLKNDGTGYFDRAARKPHMTLRGRVSAQNRKELGGQLAARIWVNSFKLPTVPVVWDEGDSGSGRFEADVVFNKAQGNNIKVEVFRAEGRLASEVGCTNTLVMDCAAPELEQQLYVLLLGTGDVQQMRDRARSALMEKALRAKPLTKQQAGQEVWESDAFTQIHVHDALNAPPAAVQNRLRELVGKMLSKLKGGGLRSGPQSIVMIYFQGQITLTKDDFAFGTLDAQHPLTRAITGRILEDNLTRGYGAHLIFLDLQQHTETLQERDVWPKAPHLGIAVSNWRGEGEQPDDSRLITVLEQTLPQSKVVRELAEKIDQRYLLARKQFPDQIETVDLLKNLSDVRIGVVE